MGNINQRPPCLRWREPSVTVSRGGLALGRGRELWPLQVEDGGWKACPFQGPLLVAQRAGSGPCGWARIGPLWGISLRAPRPTEGGRLLRANGVHGSAGQSAGMACRCRIGTQKIRFSGGLDTASSHYKLVVSGDPASPLRISGHHLVLTLHPVSNVSLSLPPTSNAGRLPDPGLSFGEGERA